VGDLAEAAGIAELRPESLVSKPPRNAILLAETPGRRLDEVAC